VATVDEVLENALVSKLTPIEWDEDAETEKAGISSSQADEDDVGGVMTH